MQGFGLQRKEVDRAWFRGDGAKKKALRLSTQHSSRSSPYPNPRQAYRVVWDRGYARPKKTT